MPSRCTFSAIFMNSSTSLAPQTQHTCAQ
jgi:hypothetical protein